MKGWNWKRLACLVSGGVLAGAGFVFPAIAPVAHPLAMKLLVAGGAGAFLLGVATKTPGHVAAEVCEPGADLLEKGDTK